MSLEMTPGICACGKRVVRAEDADGHLHTLDVHAADAATELRAWMVRRGTYTLSLRAGQMQAQPRTGRDIKLRPVGFRADRVVLAHQCTPTKGG